MRKASSLLPRGFRPLLSSLAGQLVITAVLLATAAAGLVGWQAFKAAEALILRETLRTVENQARVRHQELVSALNAELRDLQSLLRLTVSLCGQRDEPEPCFQDALAAFIQSDDALAARLRHQGKAIAEAGLPPPEARAASPVAVEPAGDLPRRYRISADLGPWRLSAWYDTARLNPTLVSPRLAEEGGESFLTDAQGYFLTAARRPASGGRSHPIDGEPMQRCLAGVTGHAIAPDYAGVPVIHGFRPTAELGGGCIMAHLPVATAFAPVRSLRNEILGLTLVCGAVAGLLAAAAARRLARPIGQLNERMRVFAAGGRPPPLRGRAPLEIRTLDRSFELLAESLGESARALRASQERHETVLQHALDAVIGVDPDGRVIDWNARAASLFGYSADEALGRPMAELIIPPRLRGGHDAAFSRAVRPGMSGDGLRRELTAMRRDGSELPVELSITSIPAPGGRAIYAFLRDLSATRRAEAARERLERLTATVNNNASVALFLMDAHQHCTYMNPAAEQMTGYTLAEAQGKPLHDLIHHTRPDGSPYPLEECPIDRALPTKNQERGEEVFVHKSGRFYQVAFTASPIVEDGVPVGTVIEVRDVTEEKRAQQERARIDAEQRFLVEAGVLLSESLDLQATLERVARMVVPQWADLCLVRTLASEGQLKTVAMAYADPAERPAVEAFFRDLATGPAMPLGAGRVLARGDSELIEEYPHTLVEDICRAYPEFRALNERVGLMSAVSVPMRAGGNTIGVLSLATTRCSGRRLGGRDLRLAEDFSRRCALALESARLFQQTAEAVQVRDEFLSIASHELKTPLTSLQIQLRSLQRRLTELVPEPEPRRWLEERLALIKRQGDRIQRLVEELLDLSRIARGQLRLELEPVDLAEVTRTVVANANAEGEPQRAGCELILDADAPVVGQWDRLRLEQVVTNLLSNALKYGAGKPVRLSVRGEGEEAVLRVIDRGMGIAPKDQERIFNRFERAVSIHHYGGLGLGLYIVRQVVETLGGRVEISSAPGRGAEFVVRLPLACAAPTPPQGTQTETV